MAIDDLVKKSAAFLVMVWGSVAWAATGSTKLYTYSFALYDAYAIEYTSASGNKFYVGNMTRYQSGALGPSWHAIGCGPVPAGGPSFSAAGGKSMATSIPGCQGFVDSKNDNSMSSDDAAIRNAMNDPNSLGAKQINDYFKNAAANGGLPSNATDLHDAVGAGARGYNPWKDTDGDGVKDWKDSDMDGDGVPDGYDTDSDGDGWTDAQERAAGTSPYDPDSHPTMGPDPNDNAGTPTTIPGFGPSGNSAVDAAKEKLAAKLRAFGLDFNSLKPTSDTQGYAVSFNLGTVGSGPDVVVNFNTIAGTTGLDGGQVDLARLALRTFLQAVFCFMFASKVWQTLRQY